MVTNSRKSVRITTASLKSSVVVEKFSKIHANNSHVQELALFLKDIQLERAPWKNPFAGLSREYISGDKKESYELCLEQYVNPKT